MTDNITLNENELRRLISDEMSKAMADVITADELERALNDRPTLRDVNALIQSQVDAAITPAVQEMQITLQTLTTTISDRFAKLETLIATIAEQSRLQEGWMRDMKDEQKRQDDEQDEIKRSLSHLETQAIEHSGKLDSQERAIFGDVTRPGTRSLFDHMSDGINSINTQMTLKFNEVLTEFQTERELSHQEISRLQQTTEAIKTDVETNTAFRQRRQRIERAAIQMIPKAGKRLWEAATSDLVVKAIKIGIGPSIIGIVLALLGRLSQ